MAARKSVHLSRRERQIMDVIYELGSATVAEVLERIPDPPSYSSIRAIIRVLEEKGHLKHRQDGPRYVFSPTVSRDKARQSALRQLVRTFFDGSTERAMAALLDMQASKLSPDELERLDEMIKLAKDERDVDMTLFIDAIGWSPEASAWIETLFAVTVRTAVVILVALILALVLRNVAARVRYVLWVTVLLAIVAVPVLMRVGPRWSAPAFPDLHVRLIESAPAGADRDPAGERAVSSTVAPVPAETSERRAAVADASPRRSAWPVVLAGVLLMGALVPLGWLGFGLLTIARITRAAEPLGGPEWNGLIADLRLHGQLPGRVRLLRSERILTPMTWGVLRSVVLMPADGDAWPPERRRVVLLHELVHVQRFDWTAQLMAQLLTALHWYNPLVWLAVRRLGLEREQSCDDAVIALGTRPSVYATHLLDVARLMKSRATAAAATLAMAKQSQLEGRLVSILNGKSDRRGDVGGGIVLPAIVLLVMSALTVSVSAVRGPLDAVAGPLWPGEQGDAVVAWTADDAHYVVDVEGPVRFNAQRTEVVTIVPAGRVIVEERSATGARRLQITPASDGSLDHRMIVDERVVAFDDDARRWMQSVLVRGLDRLARGGGGSERFSERFARLNDEMDRIYEGIEPLETEQADIEERKHPHYEELDRIDAELMALDEQIEALRDATGTTADGERERLRQLRTEQMKHLATVEAVLAPMIQRWNDLEEQLAPHYEETERFERMDHVLVSEFQEIIESELAILPPPASKRSGQARAAAVEQAVALLMEDCTVAIDDTHAWVQVAPELLRRKLQDLFATPTDAPSPFEDVDRDDLDAAINRIVRVVSSLRFVLEP